MQGVYKYNLSSIIRNITDNLNNDNKLKVIRQMIGNDKLKFIDIIISIIASGTSGMAFIVILLARDAKILDSVVKQLTPGIFINLILKIKIFNDGLKMIIDIMNLMVMPENEQLKHRIFDIIGDVPFHYGLS